MVSDTIFQDKKENTLKAFRRQPHKYVPIMSRCGSGLLDYAGTNLLETRHDKEKFRAAVFKAFEDGLPVDCLSSAAINSIPENKELFRGYCQNMLSDDGITLQHLQKIFMDGSEYPDLIKDVDYFTYEVIVKRKFPFLFEDDIKDAAKVLETALALRKNQQIGPTSGLAQEFKDRYGAYMFGEGRFMLTTPGDVLFDSYRGFKGTLTDLRRHYEEMKTVCDLFWEQNKVNHFEGLPLKDDAFPLYMSHIPCFLNQKQYEDLCFKYFKKQVEGIAAAGSKLYVLAEGKWEHLFPILRDLPQDSLLINVEDDDVCDAYKLIGDKHVLIGGSKLVCTKMKTAAENEYLTKQAIETCAPGNAFVFGSDKSWCCKGDVTPALIETFKTAKAYGNY